MRKRKGIKEQVPGYENVSIQLFSSESSSTNIIHSTTTSCKNVQYKPTRFQVCLGWNPMLMNAIPGQC
jgi:hypothetical protein